MEVIKKHLNYVIISYLLKKNSEISGAAKGSIGGGGYFPPVNAFVRYTVSRSNGHSLLLPPPKTSANPTCTSSPSFWNPGATNDWDKHQLNGNAHWTPLPPSNSPFSCREWTGKRYVDIPPMVRMLFHFNETGNCVTIRNYIIMHCRLNKIGNIFLKPQRKETEKKNKLSIKGCFLYANNIEKIKRDGYKYVLLVFF